MAIGDHVFLNAFINNSATIVEKAGADLAAPAHKAAAYDANGNVVLANDGETAVGLILSDSLDPIRQGLQVDILIKDIGLLETGTNLVKGDFIAITVGGVGKKAVSGDFVFGRAMTAVNAGECVQAQITRSGYLA